MSGRPERLYLLQLSTTTIPTAGGPMDMVAGCYLVEMSDERKVLIDTGPPPDYQLPASAVRTAEVSLLDSLEQLGIQPADIATVISTHFDIDHVGHHELFEGAEFIVQRRHYDLAVSGADRFASGRKHWGDERLRYRVVDGDTELYPGLRLIETSGHTTGHQSVLVCLPNTGPVLLMIDAVMMARLFVPDRPAWPLDENVDELRASTQKLIDLVEKQRIQVTVFGHDGAQWRDLRRAPDYYD